ncbi:MAG TPA: PPOX class F420-dependent oxidoreductase [Gaiellaceae bacterium]|nr:PPOX class F420-dependent oxidoreductase [Gaiellaceae bacterium]
MEKLTDAQLELLRTPCFAAVATLRDDGSPHTSIVWVDTDGDHVVFNTKTGRAKGKHLQRDPRVSLTVFDPKDPYRYFEVEGVAELELDGAAEHMHGMSRKYTGEDWTDVTDRVIVRVRPERIFSYQV